MPLAAVREQRLFLFEQDFTFNFSTIKGRVLVGINILTFCQKSVSSELKYLLLFPFKKLQNKPIIIIRTFISFPIFFAATAMAIPAFPPLLPMKCLLPFLVGKVNTKIV